MKYLLLGFMLLTTFHTYAQPGFQWQRAYGGTNNEYFGNIQPTRDGGYILIGTTQSKDGDLASNRGGVSDVWVTKLNASGAISWQKTFGGSLADLGYYIEQTIDTGYILIGSTQSSDGDVTFNHMDTTNHIDYDAWVVKLTDSGKISWQVSYGGTQYESGVMIHQTLDTGYIFLAEATSSDGDVKQNHGGGDIWVVKINQKGFITWQQVYGGSGSDIGYAIRETKDSGYIVGGLTYSNNGDITNYYGNGDEWVLKLTPKGKIQWQQTFGTNKLDYASDIIQTADSGYLSIGSTSLKDPANSAHDSTDMLVIKMDTAGAITWQKRFGGTGMDNGNSVTQIADGTYLAAGITSSSDGDVTGQHGGASDMWLLNINKNGNLNWQKTLGGSGTDIANRAIQTKDGGYLVGGITYSTDGDVAGSGYHSGIGPDIWIAKLNANVGIATANRPEGNIKVYPTLTRGAINIVLPEESSDATLALLNTVGQTMPVESNGTGTNRTVRLNNLPAGMYLLQVFNKGTVNTYKVIYRP